MRRVLLPDNFIGTVVNVAQKDNLIKGLSEDGLSYKMFLNEMKNSGEQFCEKEYLQFFYHKERRNKRKEQQLYQMLLLYDEVLFSDYSFALEYDYSELKKIEGITYLDDMNMTSLIYPENKRKLDFNFSQYIKDAVINNVKNNIKSFYKIRFDNYSDYKFADALYDMVYSTKEQQKYFTKKFEEFNKVCLANKQYYDLMKTMKYGEDALTKDEFYTTLLELVLECVEPVLRDFELSIKFETEIMNPAYSLEKLGKRSGNLSDISDVYGTLKVECSRVVSQLPEFSSLKQTLDFKEKHYSDVKRLRSVVDELLYILQTENREAMITKASSDVEKAIKELNRGQKLVNIDKWQIFLSLPAGVLEYYLSMPPIFSVPLSVYGISSYLTSRHIISKNNWVRVVR